MNAGARLFDEQSTGELLDTVATLEEYILHAVERGLWAEMPDVAWARIPDVEQAVSAIKSELGRRGAFE